MNVIPTRSRLEAARKDTSLSQKESFLIIHFLLSKKQTLASLRFIERAPKHQTIVLEIFESHTAILKLLFGLSLVLFQGEIQLYQNLQSSLPNILYGGYRVNRSRQSAECGPIAPRPNPCKLQQTRPFLS